MLNVITTSISFILPFVVFSKALLSALYYSSCTLHHSVLFFLHFPSTTTFSLMIVSSSSLSTQSNLTQAFLIFKMLFNTSLHVLLLIFSLLAPLRLNSCSSDSKTNLPKYTTLYLTPPTLLETSASSLTNILLSLICYYHIRHLRCIRPYLDSSTACTITTSVVHSKPRYCNYHYFKLLSLNYPVFSRSRTLLLVLSWKLPNPVISLPSYALFTGSGSLNALNTSSSHLPTKSSQLPNLRTIITPSPFNILAVLALHPSLLLLGQLHHFL